MISDAETRETYRILDASANRAGEGLRCLEEFARFVLGDADATSELKSLRHDLAAAIGRFPRSELISARDTDADVGTSITRPSETSRSRLGDVVAAAAARTGQSLRVLEEYGKILDADAAAEIEQIRYRCYTACAKLERSTGSPSADPRRQRLSDSHLYVLIDVDDSPSAFAQSVQNLLEFGVDILQLRDPQADDRTLISRARLGTEIARARGGLFIINDRADLAFAADTDGVHVGQEELPAALARQIVGPDRLVGVSTHSIDQARAAVADGADYIGCGPIFPGRTKSFDRYVGTPLLRELRDQIDIPYFAIGGIDASNVSEVVRAGCDRIAVTGVVRDADDPAMVIQTLRERLQSTGSDVNRGTPQVTDH